MLAKVIAGHDAITDFSWSKDAELDAAILLSGLKRASSNGRHCFQATYLNEQYLEFNEIDKTFKLIWLVRNPESVVCSMLYNWKRFALNELFLSCGQQLLNSEQRSKLNKWGLLSVRPIQRACLAYTGKVQQLNALVSSLSSDQIKIIDYDTLVQNSEPNLKAVCDFIEIPWNSNFGNEINKRSLAKAERISKSERTLIAQLCGTAYCQARNL